MRKILPALALATALLAGSAGTAAASAVTTSKPASLPVLYNLGGGLGSVWNNPEVRPAIFYIVADGSGAVGGMRWAGWNHSAAVTSNAIDYSRSGPCCTKADQHYRNVTVTLSGFVGNVPLIVVIVGGVAPVLMYPIVGDEMETVADV